ncbi:MAG: alanine--glyoxylate aminotransferase family protein [Acidiferrobacterales bacterium]
MKPRLFTPGPTEIPQQVVTAMANDMPHLRSDKFRNMFRDVSQKLKAFFKTKHEVLTLTASGTGAMEAAVVNLLRQSDKVIIVEGGKFGQLWGDIARTYGLRVVALEVPWGDSASPDQVKELLLKHQDAAAVLLTHCETSTGAEFDVRAIAETVHRESDAIVIIDGMSAVGVMPFYKDDWDIDVCVAGSQKGAMIPPGLSFIAVNERGWQRAQAGNLPRYYFDCLKAREALKNGDTPFTSAISLIAGLRESLGLMLDRGMEHHWEKYAKLARSTRAGAKAIGLDLLAKHPANSVTAIKVPPEIDGHKLIDRMRNEYGATVAGGQEHLKGKIFRVAHMGYCDHLDMVAFASVMELALRDCGWRFELGTAVAAVQTAYADGGKSES